MKKLKLNRKERAIEKALIQGEYHPVSQEELQSIAEAIQARKKDAVLNIRVNSQDLESLKQKAKHFGVPYQTFISELFHHYAT